MEKPNNLLGIHQLLTLQVLKSDKLTDLANFIAFTDQLLLKNELDKVGNTSHVFDNGSFTIAYCLKESHICIHTWPEILTLTMDIYLCNYSQDNSKKVRMLANDFISYFDAKIIKQIEVER
ncbi:S-adenosylmethionine decarboxylase family protein [Flavobacterium chuncheonense]|uniref:S-adenosylmethionine decarboxylase family protein n=1 Tax=Flavobacterium chuncheonense TaxID=2026653 RepID=A0ABW5YQ11_9FLAO